MAINLNKNRESLSFAWKDVLSDKTNTNWALFGYEGQTNDLKVVSTGTQGIEELIEDLSSGKIMYAFAKINDPKTSLPKCVLINWQGEGANTVRKGTCANHLRDIEKFFTGAHLTINARNEEEVDSELIIDKLSKAGSAYSFQAPRGDTSEPSKPVGTNYQRVNPIKEINAKERDQFWLKEEEEEKKRLEEERKKRDEEKVRTAEEAKRRELQETAERESKTFKRNNSIDQIKHAEKLAFESEKSHEVSYIEKEEIKVNPSDMMRKQRNQEAQNLIAQRTIDARSIFEKNTSAGQMKRTPEKPVRTSILKAQAQAQHHVQELQHANIENKIDEQQSDDESDQFSTIKRSPRDVDKKSVTSPTYDTQELNVKNEIYKEELTKRENGTNHEQVVIKEETIQQITDQQFIDEVIYGEFSTPGLQARALYDYQAADDTEITFDPGDIITNIDQVDEGWWQGFGPDGTYGLFPANYVELIP